MLMTVIIVLSVLLMLAILAIFISPQTPNSGQAEEIEEYEKFTRELASILGGDCLQKTWGRCGNWSWEPSQPHILREAHALSRRIDLYRVLPQLEEMAKLGTLPTDLPRFLDAAREIKKGI